MAYESESDNELKTNSKFVLKKFLHDLIKFPICMNNVFFFTLNGSFSLKQISVL